MSKPPLIERLHALRESLWGSEHDEKRRTLADAIARIEAADREIAKAYKDGMIYGCEDASTVANMTETECVEVSEGYGRALVREQDGKVDLPW